MGLRRRVAAFRTPRSRASPPDQVRGPSGAALGNAGLSASLSRQYPPEKKSYGRPGEIRRRLPAGRDGRDGRPAGQVPVSRGPRATAPRARPDPPWPAPDSRRRRDAYDPQDGRTRRDDHRRASCRARRPVRTRPPGRRERTYRRGSPASRSRLSSRQWKPGRGCSRPARSGSRGSRPRGDRHQARALRQEPFRRRASPGRGRVGGPV